MAGDEQLSLTAEAAAEVARRLELVELYRQISAITSRHCERGKYECQAHHLFWRYRCCQRKHCDLARERATAWGVTIPETGNPQLPFMGPGGCVVPPHLRPTCATHLCHVSHAPQSHIGGGGLDEYRELRKRIDSLEREG